MKIGFGCDHAAVELKTILMDHLKEQGFECVDYGAAAGEKVDYPVKGLAVAEAIVRGEVDKGVPCGQQGPRHPGRRLQRALHGKAHRGAQ